MRSQQLMFALLCLFVLRLIAFSGTYVDSICILSVLGYLLGLKVLESKKIENEVLVLVKKSDKLNDERFKQLSEELVRVRNSNDGIKAAINLTKK